MTFDKHQHDIYECLHASLLKNVRSYTAVLSIISAVSYVGVLRPPHPLGDDTANAVDSMPSHFSEPQALFFYFNSFAFLSAMSGLLLTTGTALSPDVLSFSGDSSCTDQDATTQMRHLAAMIPKVVCAGVFVAASTTSCAVAFLFAGLSTVREGAGLSERLPLIVPCAIGIFVFLQALLIFGRDGAHFWMQVRASDQQLWGAIKEETLVGRLLTMWGELLQPSNTTTTITHQERALPHPHHPPQDDHPPQDEVEPQREITNGIQVIISDGGHAPPPPPPPPQHAGDV